MQDDWRKDFHEKEYQKGQQEVAKDFATQDAEAHQERIRRVGAAAKQTIEQANELAAADDPHMRELAAALKDAAVGAVRRAESGQLPTAERREALEADPFLGASKTSEASSPSSSPPKALPHEQPPSPEPTEPPKRGPGRPRKHPKD